MSKKDSNKGAFHVKRHTIGTSNEISYDVLDGMRQNLSSDEEKEKKKISIVGMRLPQLSLYVFKSGDSEAKNHPKSYTSSGNSGLHEASSGKTAGSLAETKEVKRRKASRKQHNLTRVLLIIAVVIVVATTVGWFAYSAYERHKDYVATLEAAVSVLDDQKESLQELDSYIASPLDTVSLENWPEIKQGLVDTKQNLLVERTKLESIEVPQEATRDYQAFSYALEIFNSNLEKIEVAQNIFDEAELARSGSMKAQEAWYSILEGDELARDAADQISNVKSIEDISRSKEIANQAKEAFLTALYLIEESSNIYDADYSITIKYINKRIEAMEYAVASDNALLEMNVEEANAQNEKYKSSDAESIELAEKLPKTAIVPIEDALDESISERRDSYNLACERELSAVSGLGDYLGSNEK